MRYEFRPIHDNHKKKINAIQILKKIFKISATQFQQSWAYTNDVTLLAANANIPNMKSSGSGIYAGRFGALKTFMSETAASKILIAEVPINPDAENFNADELVTSEIDIKNDNEGNKETNPFSAGLNAYTFDLLQENLSNYSIEFLNFTENSNQAGSVCNNGICCNFDIEVSDNGVQDDKVCLVFFTWLGFFDLGSNNKIQNLYTKIQFEN